MNVVVSGSSGFVGLNLVKKLLEKGVTVYGIDIKTIDVNEKKMWDNQENFIQKIGNLCDVNDLRNQFHSFKDVEILRNRKGAPSLQLSKKACKKVETLGFKRFHITISDTDDYSLAFIVGEGK